MTFLPLGLDEKCRWFSDQNSVFRQNTAAWTLRRKTSMDFHEKDARSYDAHGPAPALPLVRLNHVSFQCESVEASVGFYQRVLGFELVKRPASLDLGGAW